MVWCPKQKAYHTYTNLLPHDAANWTWTYTIQNRIALRIASPLKNWKLAVLLVVFEATLCFKRGSGSLLSFESLAMSKRLAQFSGALFVHPLHWPYEILMKCSNEMQQALFFLSSVHRGDTLTNSSFSCIPTISLKTQLSEESYIPFSYRL